MKPLLLIIATCLASFALTTHATDLPDFPFVTVSEVATEKVAPDVASIDFVITSFDKSSEVAQSTLLETSLAALEVLKQHSVEKEDIRAFEITKRIIRNRDESYNDTSISGYQFSRSITFTLKDLEKYPTISEALLKTDNVGNLKSRFDVSKRSEIETQLIAKAAKKAKEKATIMARGLGVSLGQVYAFNDSGSFDRFFATFSFSSAGERIMVSGSRMSGIERKDSTLFIPASIEISKTINVIYKIEPIFFE